MHAPSAKTTAIAWISTKDYHLEMEQIRLMARRFSLTWRLSQIVEAAHDAAQSLAAMEGPKRRRRWSVLSVQQS